MCTAFIELDDIDGRVMAIVLWFIYTGRPPADTDMALLPAVALVAGRLLLHELVSAHALRCHSCQVKCFA